MTGKCCFGLTFANEGRFILSVAALAAVEAGLILAGVLPLLGISSLGSTLFTLARIAVIAYMGWVLVKIGMKEIAIRGAIAQLAGFFVLCLADLIGSYTGKSVLGTAIPSYYYLFFVFGFSAIVNAFMGAIFAVCGAWLASKFKRRK